MAKALEKYQIPLLTLLLGIFVLLAVSSMAKKSLIGDETVHLAAGYAYWSHQSPRLNPEHPPLVKLIAAVPFRLFHSFDVEKIPGWKEQRQWTFSRALLFQSGVDVDRITFWARVFCLPFGLATGLLVFLFAKTLWGIKGAFLSLVLFCLSPNVLAHSRLIHTDMAVSFGFMACAYAGWRYQKNPKLKNALMLALGLTFALLVKYSAILLLPLVFLLFVWVFYRDRPKAKRVFVVQVLWVILLPLIGMSVAYGVGVGLKPYLHGLFSVYHNHNPNIEYFMNGQFSKEGFFLYYPFAMLIKTPVPILLLLGLSLPSLRKMEGRTLLFLFLPPLTILCSGIVARHNIGLRHMLPVYPFLFVMAGGFVVDMHHTIKKLFLLFSLVWLFFEILFIHPDYLAYFNTLVGGSSKGLHYLDDSNIDVGQDLKRLPETMKTLGISKITLEYWPFADDPAYRKINTTPMQVIDLYFPQGDYAVSAHFLRRRVLRPGIEGYAYDWLEKYRPITVIGHSLYLYRFRLGPKSEFQQGINFLDESEWRAEGFQGLENLVRQSPRFFPGILALAQAHYRYGQASEAFVYLNQAEKLKPHEAQVPMLKVLVLFKMGKNRQAQNLLKQLKRRFPDETTLFPTP